MGIYVPALNYIDLSAGWPATPLRIGPKGRPGGASVRHMLEVDHNDGFISKAVLEVILLLSLPRDPDVTLFFESGNMKNLSLVA